MKLCKKCEIGRYQKCVFCDVTVDEYFQQVVVDDVVAALESGNLELVKYIKKEYGF